MPKYIFSTLTSDQKYPVWEKGPNDMPKMAGHVMIAGGANVANKNFITPKGVMTKVSDEQYKILQASKPFQRHVNRGYLKVEDKPFNVDKVSSDMEGRDDSAPLTDQDIQLDGKEPPSTSDVGASSVQESAADEEPEVDATDESESEWPNRNDEGKWTDSKGSVFDPDLHNVDDSGMPTVTPKGKFQKKSD